MSIFDQMSIAADCRDILIGLAFLKRDKPKDISEKDYFAAMKFIITSKAGMSPEVRNRVLNICFRHIKRNSGMGWAPILSAEGVAAFADIGPPEVVLLLYSTFDHNRLIDFFSDSPSSSDGQTSESGQPSQTEKIG
jgi:hypothetical protein